jgi:hypothetical protein
MAGYQISGIQPVRLSGTFLHSAMSGRPADMLGDKVSGIDNVELVI